MRSQILKAAYIFLLTLSIAACSRSLPPSLAELKVGDPAPAFTLTDHTGKSVSLSDFENQVVVLEWTNPDCPYVKRHYKADTMEQLAKKYNTKVTWLAVNSTHYMDSAKNMSWAKSEGFTYSVLNDQSGAVGKKYGAKTTPHLFIVDPAGKIAYQGAIDDDPYGDKAAPLNYVDQSVTELLRGAAVSEPKTKPYGCSVKYAG